MSLVATSSTAATVGWPDCIAGSTAANIINDFEFAACGHHLVLAFPLYSALSVNDLLILSCISSLTASTSFLASVKASLISPLFLKWA